MWGTNYLGLSSVTPTRCSTTLPTAPRARDASYRRPPGAFVRFAGCFGTCWHVWCYIIKVGRCHSSRKPFSLQNPCKGSWCRSLFYQKSSVVEEVAGRTRQESLTAWVRESLPKALAFARSLLVESTRGGGYRPRLYLPTVGAEGSVRPATRWIQAVATIDCQCVHRPRPEGQQSAVANGLGWVLGQGSRLARSPVDRAISAGHAQGTRDGRRRVSATASAQSTRRIELKSLGCSLSEIAETLEISESHAGVLVHRARRALSQELKCFLHDV